MSLLRQIQDAAIDSSTDIATLLRKAKVLAARLNHAEFKEWIDHELNGYPGTTSFPSYRVLRITVRGHFVGAFGSELKNAPIPETCLPENLRRWATVSNLREPIKAYESLASADGKGELRSAWPAELAFTYGSNVFQDMNCISAWQVISRSALLAVVDTVRTRLLTFALEIEVEAPGAGEAPPGVSPVSQEKVTQIFTTYVTGGVNNISSAGANVSQSNSGRVAANDLPSLLDYLREVGVPRGSIEDLKSDLCSSPEPAQAAAGWLGKLAMNAATGVTSTAISLAGKALAGYFGLTLP